MPDARPAAGRSHPNYRIRHGSVRRQGVTAIRHVTLAGHYIITEEHEDGTLTLAPESETAASMRRHGLRPPTEEELFAFTYPSGPAP